MDLSGDANLFREQCSCLLVKDYRPFVTRELRDFIEKNQLLAFAYFYNNENHTKHVRVVMTTARQVKLCWVRDTNPHWPYLQLCDWRESEIVGLIDIENTGWYTVYVIDKDMLGGRYGCSRFEIKRDDDPEVKLKLVCVEYDMTKSQWVELPEMPFEICDHAGMRQLEDALNGFIFNFEATD